MLVCSLHYHKKTFYNLGTVQHNKVKGKNAWENILILYYELGGEAFIILLEY